MRFTVFGAAALILLLVATDVAAEEPPVVVLPKNDVQKPLVVQTARPVRPTASRMIKGAEKLVMTAVKIKMWEGQDGQNAVLWIDPLIQVGGKFRIAYKF